MINTCAIIPAQRVAPFQRVFSRLAVIHGSTDAACLAAGISKGSAYRLLNDRFLTTKIAKKILTGYNNRPQSRASTEGVTA